MREVIFNDWQSISSMAKLNFELSEGCTPYIDYQGSDEMDKDRAPHLHVRTGGGRRVQVFLTEPFKVVGNLSPRVRREVLTYVKGNLGYLHFAWDVLTQKKFFSNEWSGEDKKELRDKYLSRFKSEFPKAPILDHYLG